MTSRELVRWSRLHERRARTVPAVAIPFAAGGLLAAWVWSRSWRWAAALVRDVAQGAARRARRAVAVVGSPIAPAAALAFPARLGAPLGGSPATSPRSCRSSD